MKIKEIQKLIDNPLKPNPTEWAMDVEDILKETNNLTENAKYAIYKTKFHNGTFKNYSDELIAILKRIIKKQKDKDKEDIIVTKENVFIVYSHQHKDLMLEIKDFVRENLGFEPKTLDISEFTGSVWEAFANKTSSCEKAIVLMTEDDLVKDSNGNEYNQSRPNVFIELGYMIHKCGLNNVTIVRTADCVIPSDVTGLTSVIYNNNNWTENLRKQLNR